MWKLWGKYNKLQGLLPSSSDDSHFGRYVIILSKVLFWYLETLALYGLAYRFAPSDSIKGGAPGSPREFPISEDVSGIRNAKEDEGMVATCKWTYHWAY